MERHFDQQMEKLKTRFIKMCSLVDEQVELSIRSISENNPELANLVIERDDKVDKYDIKIDKLCQKLIALNQPVAFDLRVIMSSLVLNTNLERIGDIAVNIARDGKSLEQKPSFYEDIKFEEAANIAKQMVKMSTESFIDNNAKTAREVLQLDDSVDAIVKDSCDKLIKIMKANSADIDAAIKFYSMMHDLERLGDHATNIAELVYFIVEAQLIKHRYEDYLWKQESGNEDNDNDEKLNLE